MNFTKRIAIQLSHALVLALPWPSATQAAVTQDWAFVSQGKSGAMLALGSANNTFVAGSVPLGTILLTNHSPAGAQWWERVFDNPVTREEATWVTLDPAGIPFIVGMLVSTASGVGAGLIVLKYDPAGTLLWQVVIPVSAGFAVRAVTDTAGNVFVPGSGGTGLGREHTSIKYSPGGVRQWVRNDQATPIGLHGPAAMVVTPADNVIFKGGHQATMYAVACDTNGNQFWVTSIAPAMAANDVVLGPQGEVYLVGGDTTPAAIKRILVVKHDANFNELWRQTCAVGSCASRAGVDSLGNLVNTGVTLSADWMTLKLDPSGTLLWSRTTNKRAFTAEAPNGLTIRPGNTGYVAGEAGRSSADTTHLGATSDPFAADGTLVWSTQAHVPSRGLGIKLGSNGTVFVLGNGPRALLHCRQDGTGTALPTAMSTASTMLVSEPLSVNSSSAGSTGAIVSTFWNFGGFSGSFDTNPMRECAAGTCTVNLRLTDNVGGSATSAPITITGNPALPPPPAPVSVTFRSPTVKGAKSVAATAHLKFTGLAPTALTVTPSNHPPGVASVPASILVPLGATSATLPVGATKVRRTTAVVITATTVSGNASGNLTV